MATYKYPMIAGVGDTTQGVTKYQAPCGGTWGDNNGLSEVAASIRSYNSYTLSNLYAVLSDNSLRDPATIRLRKNGGNGNQVISLSAFATGSFTDATHTDSIVNTDTFCYQMVTTANGSFPASMMRITDVSVQSSCSTPEYIMAGCFTASDALAPAITEYVAFEAGSGTTVATNVTRNTLNAAISIKQLGVYVVDNLNSSGSGTITDISTTLSVSLAAGASGEFSDTANTKVFVTNQDLYYIFSGSYVGGFNLHMGFFRITVFTSPTDVGRLYTALTLGGGTSFLSIPSTGFTANLAGAMWLTGTDHGLAVGISAQALDYYCGIIANSSDGTATIGTGKNAALSSLQVSVSSSSTGAFSDTTHTVNYSPNDTIEHYVNAAGSSGNIQVAAMGVRLLALPTSVRRSSYDPMARSGSRMAA